MPWVFICKVPSFLCFFYLRGEGGGHGFGFLSGFFAEEGDGTCSGFEGDGEGLGHHDLNTFGTGFSAVCLVSLKSKFPRNASLI